MTDYFRDFMESPPPILEEDKKKYEEFIHQLKLNAGGIFAESQENLENQMRYFLFRGHLSNILEDVKPNDISKLPDLIANVYRGVYPSMIPTLDTVVEYMLKNVAYAIHKESLKSGQLLSTLCLNLMSYWSPADGFVRNFHLETSPKDHLLLPLMKGLDRIRRGPIYRFYLRHCQSADEIQHLFGSCDFFFSDVHELLISKSSFDSRTSALLLCCFREKAIDILLEFLKLWSDPVIAKAQASTEILYYTRAVFISFYHVPSQVLKERYLDISKCFAEGLPHHFSSTDGRTLKLAKFLSEFMIYTLKSIGGGESGEESEGLPIHPPDDLSRDLLSSFQPCCSIACNFWYNKYFETKTEDPKEPPCDDDNAESKLNEEDSDDEDDLEPIETLDAPLKCPVVYVRDFIENLPDFLENIDQMTLIFQRLPTIVDAQLRLEHSSTCKEMLEVVFSWNNSFDEASLDEYRKKSLEAILIASPEVTIPEICRYFHNRPNTIAPERCLILDVLSRTLSNPKLDLSILKYIADSYFHLILREEGESIRDQASPVQVPMVLLSAQILTRLPSVMSKDSYLKSFLSAINGLVLDSDHGMRETIVFALHQICKAPILTSSSLSPELRTTLGETRNLLTKVLN